MDQLAAEHGLWGLYSVAIDVVSDQINHEYLLIQRNAVRDAGLFFPRAAAADLPGSFEWAAGAISVAYPLPLPRTMEIARFATPTDITGKSHYDLFRERMDALAVALSGNFGIGRYLVSVDGSSVIDRAVALAAGLGWRGKSTNVLTKAFGSWVMLGSIVTEAAPDESIVRSSVASRCGSCVACVQACPTGALGDAYKCDAERCLSLITQSARPIEDGDAEKIGPMIYGCDRCQEVCPVNLRLAEGNSATHETGVSDRLVRIASASDEELRKMYPGLYFPSKNIGLLRRNALIATNNLAG